MEQPVLGADETHLHALAGNLAELREEIRICLRVRDDQVRQLQRLAVDGQ